MATLTVRDTRSNIPDSKHNIELVIKDEGFELLSNGIMVIDAGNITDIPKFWLRKGTVNLRSENTNLAEYEILAK